METIRAVIQASRKQTNTQYNNSPQSLSSSTKEFLTAYQTRGDVESSFSPQKWGFTVANPERAYLADCPTLLVYDKLYGDNSAYRWIKIQVIALFGSSSSKEKGVVDGIGIFSSSFAAQVGSFKLSELMLFFARYKAGRYDNSYSSFDARRVGNAFFKEFIPERNNELDKINRDKVQKEIEERRYTPPAGYNSFSWYMELKKRASNGDLDAMRELGIECKN